MIQLIIIIIALLGIIMPEKLFGKKQVENMGEDKFRTAVKSTRFLSIFILVATGLSALLKLV